MNKLYEKIQSIVKPKLSVDIVCRPEDERTILTGLKKMFRIEILNITYDNKIDEPVIEAKFKSKKIDFWIEIFFILCGSSFGYMLFQLGRALLK